MPQEILRLKIDPTGAVRGSREFGRATQGAAASALSLDRVMSGLAATFGVYAAARGVGSAIKASIEWEQSLTGVAKTVEATDAEIQALGASLQEMSGQIPVAATEIAGIAEAAGQLGIQTENITEFTRVMADLGVTTNLTSEQAATSFARLANIMGTPQSAFDRLGSTVVDLGNNLATTEAEITEFATRMAGAGRIAGLTEANILAIGGAMSSVGIEAEAGGTAVQKALIDINTSVATGNENLAKFAETAGMTSEEFRTAWEEDAGTAFTAFVEGLGSAGNQATTVLDELGLSNQRLVRAFLSLANAGPLLRQSIDRANTAWEENNALTKEAERFYETTGNRLEVLKNRMKVFGVETVTSSGAVGDVVDALEELADFLEQNEEAAEAAQIALRGLAEVVITSTRAVQGAVFWWEKYVALVEAADRLGFGGADEGLRDFEQGLVATIGAQDEANAAIERGKDFVREMADARAEDAEAAERQAEAAARLTEEDEEAAEARKEALQNELDLLTRSLDLGLRQEEASRRLLDHQKALQGVLEDSTASWEDQLRAAEQLEQVVQAMAENELWAIVFGGGALPGQVPGAPRPEDRGELVTSQEAIADIEESIRLATGAMGAFKGELDELAMIDQATRGVVSFADGLGLVEGNARDAVRGISDILGGLQSIKGAGGISSLGGLAGFGGALGVAGGVAGILGGLFGGGEQEAKERARQEAIERANDALRDFGDSLRVVTELEKNRTTAVELFDDALRAAGIEAGRLFTRKGDALGFDVGFVGEAIEDVVAAGGGIDEVFDRLEEGFGGIKLSKSAIEDLRPAIEAFVEDLGLVQAAFERQQAAIGQNLEVERLRLVGLDKEARALQNQIAVQEAVADGWTEANVAALEHVQVLKESAAAERERAEAEAEAAREVAEAEERAATARRFNLDLALRDAQLRGNAEAEIRARHAIRVAEELDAAEKLLQAGTITQEMYDQLARTLTGELAQALDAVTQSAREAAQAAQEAAAAQARLSVQMVEDLRVREALALGMDREAALRRFELEQRREIQDLIESGANERIINETRRVQALEAEAFRKELQERFGGGGPAPFFGPVDTPSPDDLAPTPEETDAIARSFSTIRTGQAVELAGIQRAQLAVLQAIEANTRTLRRGPQVVVLDGDRNLESIDLGLGERESDLRSFGSGTPSFES